MRPYPPLRFLCILLLPLLLVAAPPPATDAPTTDGSRYLFFLHQRFLEGATDGDVHPEFGPADYSGTLAALGRTGLRVISERRTGNVNARTYAAGIVAEIDRLVARGVSPRTITVVGASKGGYIAQYVATLAADARLNFVFLGAYRDEDLVRIPDIDFCGRILNIYERSDPYGTAARRRAERSSCPDTYLRDLELRTGLGHGFLFRPLPEWVEPTLAWAAGRDVE